MKTSKVMMVLATLAFATGANAADEGFKITGDLATSIFVESGKGNNSDSGGIDGGNGTGAPASAGQATSANNDFSVDMVELNIEKSLGNSTVVLGIGYGRIFDTINNTLDANQALGGTGPVAGSPLTAGAKSSLNLTNAYFMHKIGDTGLSFKLGKFETFIGHETYNYMDNMNYTRSYAFYQTQPWFHTGLAVNYTHEMFDAGVYIVNSSANTDLDENRNKSFGVSLGVKPVEGLSLKFNGLMGKDGNGFVIPTVTNGIQDVQILNFIAAYNMNAIDVALNYTMKTAEQTIGGSAKDEVSSLAGYVGYKAEVWGAGLRYEMFKSEPEGAASTDINAFTLSAHYNPDQNATLKVDIGMQTGEDTTFAKDDGTADDALNYYGLGLMYRF